MASDSKTLTSKQLDKDYVWLRGMELKELFIQEEIMFIWGVFASFPNGTKLKNVLKFPFVTSRWEWNVVETQNRNNSFFRPLGDTEFISWDGTVLLVKSKDINIIDEFTKEYSSLAKDLEEYNSN